MTDRRRPDASEADITITLKLDELMVVNNLFNIGAAVAGTESGRTTIPVRSPIASYINMAAASLGDLGQARLGALQRHLATAVKDAIQEHGITDIAYAERKAPPPPPRDPSSLH